MWRFLALSFRPISALVFTSFIGLSFINSLVTLRYYFIQKITIVTFCRTPLRVFTWTLYSSTSGQAIPSTLSNLMRYQEQREFRLMLKQCKKFNVLKINIVLNKILRLVNFIMSEYFVYQKNPKYNQGYTT